MTDKPEPTLMEAFEEALGPKEECGTCRYWKPWEPGEQGWCRRYPPQIVAEVEGGDGWVRSEVEDYRPTPKKDNWCGEWRKK